MQDAGTGLLDIARLGDMLARVKKRIVTRRLDRVSPLAVPALLEISREMVAGEVDEDILRDNEDALIRGCDACGLNDDGDDLLINVNGESLLLDACGAAFCPAHSTLMFADLHFEKGSSYARGRQFLPPYDTADTLLRMAQAMARHKPARVIALGDSFHDRDAADRLGAQERALAGVAGPRRRTSSGSPAITIPIRPPGWAARSCESWRWAG